MRSGTTTQATASARACARRAGDAREWAGQLACLAGELSVVAWDEPGAGRSSDLPSADFGLAGVAETLIPPDRGARAGAGAYRRPLVGRTIALESAGCGVGRALILCLSDLLPRIAVPPLLIWGEQDEGSGAESVARQFHEAIPDSQLVLIADAGHVSTMERPS